MSAVAATVLAAPHPARAERPAFAQLLARWRKARKISQMQLAMACEISQKHLAYLEVGRTRPSRAMVLTLGAVLDLPLHERNGLLGAAGFAPVYPNRRLDDPAMRAVHEAIDLMLRHHEPNPSLVMDRDWNILRQNTAMKRLMRRLIGDRAEAYRRALGRERGNNILHSILHPQGLRPCIANWQETAPLVLARVRREEATTGRESLTRLVSELVQYPGVSGLLREPAPGEVLPPVVAIEYASPEGDFRLRLFTLCSTFGTPQDVTTDELRVESSFPADEASAEVLRRLAAQAG